MIPVVQRVRQFALRLRLKVMLTIGFVGLPIVAVLIGALVVQETSRSAEITRGISHAAGMRNGILAAVAMVQDAESGQRGFLLTGKNAYLAPYNQARAALPKAFEALAALAQTAPERAAVGAFQRATQDKLAELAETIQLDKIGDAADVMRMVATDRGQEAMDRIRHTSGGLQHGLEAQINMLAAARQESLRNTMIAVSLLLGAMVFFLVTTVIAVVANLREREDMVEQLAAAKRRADEASRAKSEFLAGMSHELRTPLNAILGFSEVIMQELFGPVGMRKYVDYARDVHRSGQHLLDLINDVLDLSKIDAGKMEVRDSEVKLSELIEDSVSLVGGRARGSVSLHVEAMHDVPMVIADRRLLKQILLNLLSNAIKFTPKGGTVTVGVRHHSGGDLKILVSDTGIGMTPAELDKALSQYGQIDSRVARKHKGTGLGLPISRSLALLHGGDLRVNSEHGAGTTVTVVIPAARVRYQTPSEPERVARQA